MTAKTPKPPRPRRIAVWVVYAAVIGSVLAFAVFEARLLLHPGEESRKDTLQKPISVKTVTAQTGKDFQITVRRPASVEAYYRADLESQVAGAVKWVHVANGSVVDKDQVVVKIDVPEKVATVKEKQNIISQRESELALAQEKHTAAKTAVKTAQANVELKKTLLLQAQADTRLRDAQFTRIDLLWKQNAQDKNVRDEALRGLEVAQVAEKAAEAARIKAEAEVEDANANVNIAQAEVNRARGLIAVARSDYDQATTYTAFAEVKAPFRGAVVARHIDPGSFVQNASTGRPSPLLTLQRADIVTVVMRVPDNYASYINPGTQAVIELDDLPGLKVLGKVTRFAPSLVTSAHDMTMRVEVDLWNDAPEKYQPFLADEGNRADLKDGPLPLLPDYGGKKPKAAWQQLIPGKFGNMTLILKTYGEIKLIPSQAIVRQGGRTSVYLVQDGKAHLVPVEVQVDDGTVAHLVLLDKDNAHLGELADGEQVVVSNQEELSEGQAVNAVPREGWGTDKPAQPSP